MDGWDLALMGAAGYTAVVGLVRLMNRRRNQLIDELMQEVAEQRRLHSVKPGPAQAAPAAAGQSRLKSMGRQLYIETVGCQMNVLDSELVAASLVRAGYELVDSLRKADTILFNTCSVRQHAEGVENGTGLIFGLQNPA